MNLLFNAGRREPAEAALAAESPTPGVTPDYDVPSGTTPPSRRQAPSTH